MIDTLEYEANYAAFDKAVSEAVVAVNDFANAIRRSNIIATYQMWIAFSDDPKDKRKLIRDLARFTRKPSLIHNGKKNRK